MALNENVQFIKNELSSEEKFLESSVKLERFYKKYKFIILGGVSLLVVGFISYNVKTYFDEENKKVSNIAFSEFISDMKNESALSTLKDKNKKLYEIAQYLKAKNEAKDTKNDIIFLNSLSDYSLAIASEDSVKLNTISMKNDFLLKEFALFNKALIETKNSKFDDARATLKLIPSTSKVNDLVQILNHYLITK